MPRRRVSLLVLPLGLFLSFSLGSCGQRVCVAGIGDCAITSKPAKDSATQTSSDGDLTLEASKHQIKKGESVSVTIKNYSGNIHYSIVSGPTGNSNINSNTLSYSAPNDINEDTSIRIKVWDDRYKNDTETPLAVAYITIDISKE